VQWYNGILLLASFFSCRLLWGTYQSIRVYQDIWAGLHYTDNSPPATTDLKNGLNHPDEGVMRFFTGEQIPVWLALVYLGSNVILNSLNFYWFGKMIETVRSRFQEPRKGPRGEVKTLAGEVGIEGMDGGDIGEPTSTDEDTTVNDETTEVDGLAQNNQTELAYMHKGNRIMVEKTEVRKRRPG
jgi:hypothetical protein